MLLFQNIVPTKQFKINLNDEHKGLRKNIITLI